MMELAQAVYLMRAVVSEGKQTSVFGGPAPPRPAPPRAELKLSPVLGGKNARPATAEAALRDGAAALRGLDFARHGRAYAASFVWDTKQVGGHLVVYYINSYRAYVLARTAR